MANKPTPTDYDFVNVDEATNARRTLRDFIEWRRVNPRAWDYGLRFALNAKACGRIIGGPAVVEAVRRKDFTDDYGTPTKINNNFAAPLARTLLSEHPELNGTIKLRKSLFDAIMPEDGGAADV